MAASEAVQRFSRPGTDRGRRVAAGSACATAGAGPRWRRPITAIMPPRAMISAAEPDEAHQRPILQAQAPGARRPHRRPAPPADRDAKPGAIAAVVCTVPCTQ